MLIWGKVSLEGIMIKRSAPDDKVLALSSGEPRRRAISAGVLTVKSVTLVSL